MASREPFVTLSGMPAGSRPAFYDQLLDWDEPAPDLSLDSYYGECEESDLGQRRYRVVAVITQEMVAACPMHYWTHLHYREDGTCRCDEYETAWSALDHAQQAFRDCPCLAHRVALKHADLCMTRIQPYAPTLSREGFRLYDPPVVTQRDPGFPSPEMLFPRTYTA